MALCFLGACNCRIKHLESNSDCPTFEVRGEEALLVVTEECGVSLKFRVPPVMVSSLCATLMEKRGNVSIIFMILMMLNKVCCT